MKLTTKYSLLFVGLVYFAQISKAQDDRDFRIGFKIIPGFNWINSKSNNILKDGSGIGFSFGLMADIKLADNYFFTPEINITSMSNRMKFKDTTDLILSGNNRSYDNVSYKYSLKYIEIPLTFKFRTNENGGMRYWGQIGIAPGFVISNTVTTSAAPSNGNATPFPETDKYLPNSGENDNLDFVDNTDNINIFRAAMILGAGIEYNLSGNTSFYTGLRFNNGFTDIRDSKKSNVINNVLGLEIGLFF